jgi:thiol-disulfide isomerase/thioredoxin
MNKIFASMTLAVILLVSCSPKEPVLTPGIWRAVLLTSDSTEIPFNFELKIAQDTTIEIITGDYRYEVKDIEKRGDSLFINMPLFSSSFALHLTAEGLKGDFLRTSYKMAVNAAPDEDWRFVKEPQSPEFSAAGRWLVRLGEKELIGEFSETAGKVTGSFLTPSGDYRFFEGLVTSENRLMMSCFDGGFIRLFTADMISADSLANVKMYSGFSTLEEGSAVRRKDAVLPDAYSITGMKKGYKTLGFSFPNLDGNAVSLKDERFKDKVVILQISGSWCPNCLDESKFLGEVADKYSPSLEVVCLAFERPEGFEAAKAEAMKLVTVAGIKYEVLITGSSPAKLKEVLPELENFRAFPTTIFIDKKGVVRRIHSGFSGPGTGIHYQNFVKEFTTFVEGLIAE